MAKWSLWIEMQAVDTGEHRSIYRQIYRAGKILDHSNRILCWCTVAARRSSKARALDQEKTPPPPLPHQRYPLPREVQSGRRVGLQQAPAHTGGRLWERGVFYELPQAPAQDCGSAELVGGEGLLFQGVHQQAARDG
jgi:hypothetical protein